MFARFAGAIAVVACLVGPATAQTYDWPMLGCDAQRSNYTPEKVGAYVDYPQWEFQWAWTSPSPIPWRAQVVAAKGIAAVGTYDGKLHAIDLATGQTKWTYPTGGPILHSAAIADGRVYCTSHDKSVYCVDAKTGEKLWSYRTGKPIVAAPLVVAGRVYVGSKDGWFYALDAKTGDLTWKCQVGEPIVVSAAYSDAAKLLFTGTSTVEAVAITLDGEVKWRRQLLGQSLQEAWPTVSELHGVVVYRPHSIYDMWNNIQAAGNGHADKPEDARLQGIFQTRPASLDAEQDGISEYLVKNPHRRVFFALDVQTGRDKYAKPVPVLWSWGISATMNALIVDNHTDRAWACWRTIVTEGQRCEVPDVGELNLATGRFVKHEPWTNQSGDMQTGLWGGDEPWPISGAGDTIFETQNHGPHGWSLINRKSFCILGQNLWEIWRVPAGKRTDAQTYIWPPSWKRNVMSCIYTNRRVLWTGGSGVGCYMAP